MTSVSFSYKNNPEKYHSSDASFTAEVPDGMSPATVMKAARAIVFTTLGMRVASDDKRAAKQYLDKTHPETLLSDFAPA